MLVPNVTADWVDSLPTVTFWTISTRKSEPDRAPDFGLALLILAFEQSVGTDTAPDRGCLVVPHDRIGEFSGQLFDHVNGFPDLRESNTTSFKSGQTKVPAVAEDQRTEGVLERRVAPQGHADAVHLGRIMDGLGRLGRGSSSGASSCACPIALQ